MEEIKLYMWTIFGRPLFLNDDEIEEYYEYIHESNRLSVFFNEDISWTLVHMNKRDKILSTLRGKLKNSSDVKRLYRLFINYVG
jgi:hypothetical protein